LFAGSWARTRGSGEPWTSGSQQVGPISPPLFAALWRIIYRYSKWQNLKFQHLYYSCLCDGHFVLPFS
jgi:hypothetical protein